MTVALKAVAGLGLKGVLKRLTSNRFIAVFTGAGATAVVQSSSVTTVLVVGFISAGVMTLQQSIGVIMGANIGTTITAQVIAFKITKYALGLVFFGWFPLFFLKKDRWRQSFTALMGLGIVFLGMALMGEATQPLRSYQPFIEWMQRLESPLLGVCIGAGFTALVQSSSATTAIVIMLASQGLLPLEGGIALCMGANIGTCFTALLASIGKNRESLQAVTVHILFNVAGVLIWIGLIEEMSRWMVLVSPVSDMVGFEKLAAETPRQIANAHTFFNVTNTLLLLPFTGYFANWVRKLIPDKPSVKGDERHSFLDQDLLKTPAFALDRARMENLDLGQRVLSLLKLTRAASVGSGQVAFKEVSNLESEIDQIQGDIVTYLATLSRDSMSEKNSRLTGRHLQLANYMEAMGDIMSDNAPSLEKGFREVSTPMSDGTRHHFENLFSVLELSLGDVLLCLEKEDYGAAKEVIEMKAGVEEVAFDITHRLEERLTESGDDRLKLYRLETDLVETIKRLFYLTKRMAKVLLDIDEILKPV
jgi:phosphate:Na+ symporter